MPKVCKVLLVLMLLSSTIPITFEVGGFSNQLVVQAPPFVLEGQWFNVTVSVNESWVANATVLFYSHQYTTNFYGFVRIQAPLVATNQSYPIVAQKTGYQDGETSISVINVPPSLPLLDISAPLSVSEGEYFSVMVASGGQPVSGVEVVFNSYSYYTVGDGSAQLLAPNVSGNHYFTIVAQKDGYASDQTTILVLDEGGPSLPQLQLQAPSSVDEGTIFLVVVSTNGTPLQNATVLFNSLDYSTDATGTVSIQAPFVTKNTVYVIEAMKSGYQDGSRDITVVDTGQSSQPLLMIECPSSVTEGSSFEVTMTADGVPVSNVTVVFNEKSFTTDTNGYLTLEAPLVSQTAIYYLSASKEGYRTGSASLSVLNQPSDNPPEDQGTTEGTICGYVTTVTSQPIDAAEVCIILSNSNNEIINQCTLSNHTGYYNISVAPGTYAMKASKIGYLTATVPSVIVQKNVQTTVNFTLENITELMGEQYLIDYAMKKIVEQGWISGAISVQYPEEQQQILTEVSLYKTPVSVMINTATAEQLVFSVNGSEAVHRAILTVRFGPGTLEDMNNVTILYDNESISWVSFDEIFHSDNTTTARWSSVLAIDGEGQEILYCIISAPLSTHTITISSLQHIVEEVGGLMVILFYLGIAVVAAVAFIGFGEISKRL